MCHNVTDAPKENAQDKIFLELRPEVKVNKTVIQKQYTTISDTKFGVTECHLLFSDHWPQYKKSCVLSKNVLGCPSTQVVQIIFDWLKTWPPGGMACFSYVNIVVVFVLNVPPTAKVIWRRGHSLKSHRTDW